MIFTAGDDKGGGTGFRRRRIFQTMIASNREMRQRAWKTATSRWSGRIILLYAAFLLVVAAVFLPLGVFFEANGVQTWEAFNRSQLEAKVSGLELAVPNVRQWWTMTGASAFTSFLQNIFTGILFVGLATVLLQAVRDRRENWFGRSFAGFRYPFGMFWLTTLMTIRIILWTLLFIVPGVIATFRYAMAWYVKSEHLDWSASRCLAESGRLMKGYKWRYACYTMGFLGWTLLTLVPAVAGAALAPVVPLLVPACFLMFTALFAFTLVYIGLGHAVFYEEVVKGASSISDSSVV